MIAIVDSGSTKSDWIIVDKQGNKQFNNIRTKGLNPAILSKSKLIKYIKKNDTLLEQKDRIEHLFFYGAGCGTDDPKNMLVKVLSELFINAKVSVNEDTLAAVYATINNNEPAIVCVMGTGSNCSYYDGVRLHQRVKSLGYILMDDASGNYFGKQLIRDYYFNHMPEDIKVYFSRKYNLNADFLKQNLYKKPHPNAYLADFAEFMFLNKDSKYIVNLIKKGLTEFANNMIFQYKDELQKVPVHFVGSIAYFVKDEIKVIAKEKGFKVGNFVRRPIEGLVKYHINNFG